MFYNTRRFFFKTRKLNYFWTIFLKGNAVKKLIKEEGYKREEIFITTKVNSHEYTYDKTMTAMKKSFEKLGLDYVDLVSYWFLTEFNFLNQFHWVIDGDLQCEWNSDFFLKVLIHSPGMPPNYKGDLTKTLSEDDLKKLPNTAETYQEARISMWEALQDLKKQGRIRDIGISNFNRFHIEQLITNPR